MSGKVRVTQVRGTVGQSKAHEGTLRALGLGKIGRTVEHADSPVLAGMIRHVKHLVRVDGAVSGVGSTEPPMSAGAGLAGAEAGNSGVGSTEPPMSAGAGLAGAEAENGQE